nr:L28 family ribosomal protein [Staphylococcus aureus]
MPKQCFLTAPKPSTANRPSHPLNSTKPTSNPNLQKLTILLHPKPKKLSLSPPPLKSPKLTTV